VDDSDADGNQTVTITASATGYSSGSATVTIIDNEPTANDDSAKTDVNTTVSIAVLSNDSDPNDETLSVIAVDNPTKNNGTAVIEGENVKYTPPTDFVGTDEFNYQISNTSGGTASATVTIEVGAFYTYGSVVTVKSSEVDVDLESFDKKPKVTITYTDIKGKSKKLKLKVVTKVPSNSGDPVTEVRCEIPKKILLYNKKDFKNELKSGNDAETYLQNNPISNITASLYVKTKETGEVKLDKSVIITTQTITAVKDSGNDLTVGEAGQEVIINGTFMGKKAQKAWLEYKGKSKNGITPIKSAKCKVEKIYTYDDAKGNEETSAMDVDNGTSVVYIALPNKFKKDWDHSADHNIVIDNGVGIATVDFKTKESSDN